MNRVMLIGRLTAKPELRYTGSNIPYARFSVAINRTFSNSQGQRETDFINVIIWRKQAENVCQDVPMNDVNVDNDPFADFGDSVSIDDSFLD